MIQDPKQARLEEFVDRAIDQLTGNAGRLQPKTLGQRQTLSFAQILLPVDDSAASRNAFAWARRIASTFHGRVTTLAVVEPATLGQAFFGPDGDRERAVARAKDQVERWTTQIRGDGARAAGAVERGFIVPRIVKAAQRDGADLVVLGSKGGGPWARLLLGSVVDATKNQVRQSVLIAKKPGPARLILLATDGSRESKRAARAALQLARAWKAQLTVLYVLPKRLGSASGIPHDPFTESFPLAEQPPWRDVKASFLVLFGRPAETIVAQARKQRVDLIVMGSRGLSGIRSLVPGGVSNRVAHASPCSVLLVKSEV